MRRLETSKGEPGKRKEEKKGDNREKDYDSQLDNSELATLEDWKCHVRLLH